MSLPTKRKKPTTEQLWQQMADMTMDVCRKKCHRLGSCCEPMYCEIAKEYASGLGVELEETGNEIPFLKDGKCVVPPHLRPMCTLHQCDINGVGFFKGDLPLTKKYFRLRERLERSL